MSGIGYAQMVARRTWDDMRRAKRRPSPPPGETLPRQQPTAAEAAAELRRRMEEKKRSKSLGTVSNEDSKREASRSPEQAWGSQLLDPHQRTPNFLSNMGMRWEQLRKQAGVKSGFASNNGGHMDSTEHHISYPSSRFIDESADVRVMADITSAVPHRGTREVASESAKWSAPSALEARMLGVSEVLPPTNYSKRSRDDGGDVLRALDLESDEPSRQGREAIDLVVKMARGGPLQEQMAQSLRQMVHDKAVSEALAKEEWALRSLAKVLTEGSDHTRAHCCACFRHLALEDEGSVRMMMNPSVLDSLVVSLKMGNDSARTKAAAAIGNLAWRSERNRGVICALAGLVDGLLLLLRVGTPKCKESALAAFSNLTLSGPCSLEVAKSDEALSELKSVLMRGSPKAQLRAAGIVRNLARDEGCRGLVADFPGLLAALRHLQDQSTNSEIRQRVEVALGLLSGYEGLTSRSIVSLVHKPDGRAHSAEPAVDREPLPEPNMSWRVQRESPTRRTPSPVESVRSARSNRSLVPSCGEEEAVARLQHWLAIHGWRDVQARLFDAGHTKYDAYAHIEPNMLTLDDKSGLYLWNGRTVQLVGEDRYNPMLLMDIQNREVVWDFEDETDFKFPWARQHFVRRVEGESVMILLKRNGKIVARSETAIAENGRRSRRASADHQLRRQSAAASTDTSPRDLSLHSSVPDDGSVSIAESFPDDDFLLQPSASAIHDADDTNLLDLPPSRGSPRDGHVDRLLHHGPRRSPDPDAIASASASRPTSPVGMHADSSRPDAPPAAPPRASSNPGGSKPKPPTNPVLWRKLMTLGTPEGAQKGGFIFQGQHLTLPMYGPDGLATIRDRQSKEIVYQGPGRHEVMLPPSLTPSNSAPQQRLVAWANAHGWHDLKNRLLDGGKTDYAQYATYEREMTEIKGSRDLFTWRGRALRLAGESRMNPRLLVDDQTKEVLWDYDKATKFAFPWARETLALSHRGNEFIEVREKQTGALLAELELAAFRNVPGTGTPGTGSPPAESKDDVHRAVELLKEWTKQKGWYELQRRLLDAGDTNYSRYAEIEPYMQIVAGTKDVYSWQGRTLRLIGTRKVPRVLKDDETGEVLWALDRSTNFRFPWARDNFALSLPDPSAGRIQIKNKRSGAVVANVTGRMGGGDRCLFQAISMEHVPMHQRRGLSKLMECGREVLQVVKEFRPQPDTGQLALAMGEALIVGHLGGQGWNFGKVVVESNGTLLFKDDPSTGWGREGWYPSTFAVPMQELFLWRGKCLWRQLSGEGGSDVCFSDASTGEVLYSGPAEGPEVQWMA